MILNPENDIYQGDLATLNTRKHAWSSAEKSAAKYRTGSWIVLAIGFAVIVFTMLKVRGGETSMSQLPMHISIWATALAAILVNRMGKKRSEQPFAGFHMAHFETDDDTLYYQYQKGMTLQTYYIKDNEIKRIYRDDEHGVLLFEGEAKINVQTRKGETERDVSAFYALVPFDKYDLDDLLAPYKGKVKTAQGELRERFSEEHL
ncbi:MAG: hypothetical protein IKE52_07130 [Mogibacterium sp.]|nr:hypothetical protein [Mogibacterium sp.]